MPTDKRRLVEGYWDCQYCGQEGIPGRFKTCTGCGHPRDASVRFYTKEIDEEHGITREEFERESAEAEKYSRSSSANYTGSSEVEEGTESLYAEVAGRGEARERHDESDWYCDFCDSYNPATNTNCQFCGAAREDSEGKTYRQTQGQMARTYDSKGNLVRERDLSKPQAPKPQAQPSSGGPGCLRIAIFAIGIIALVAVLGAVLFGPKAKKIEVAGFDWEQTIEVEQLQTTKDSGWILPSGARLQYTREEVREYEQVLSGYETVPYEVSEEVLDHYETYTTEVDNGDGTFTVEEHEEPVYKTEYHTEERQEPIYVSMPVYDTKYYYEIEKWVPERDVTTSGDDHNPRWGEVELAEGKGENNVGAEREGTRYGTYGLTDTKGNRYTAEKDLWDSFEIGGEYELMVDSSQHVTKK